MACFEIVTEENFSLYYEILTEKDESDEAYHEYIQLETQRALKFSTPEVVNSPKFMKDLKKKYQPKPKDASPMTAIVRRQKYCELIVGGLKALVEEMRNSKVFLGPDGVPIRRSVAKTILKKSDG